MRETLGHDISPRRLEQKTFFLIWIWPLTSSLMSLLFQPSKDVEESQDDQARLMRATLRYYQLLGGLGGRSNGVLRITQASRLC